MTNESIKKIIDNLKDEKTVLRNIEVVDSVIALQLERILELDHHPEIQEDAVSNLVDLLILREGVY